MKIAITGANGFLGSQLVRSCINKGYEPIVLVRSNSSIELLPGLPKIHYVGYPSEVHNYIPGQEHFSSFDSLSLIEHKKIVDIIKNSDILIHNAGLTKAKTWSDFKQANVDLTSYLIDIVNENPSLKHFIFISSQAAAGESNGIIPKIESDNCHPLTLYGKSKLLAENIVKTFCKKPYTIVRPSSVFGPGDRDFLGFFKMVKKGISILVGNKERFISLIYVEDLAKGILELVNNKQTFNQTFFISDGHIYTWQDFIKSIENAFGKETIRIVVPETCVKLFSLFSSLYSRFSVHTPTLNQEKIKEILGRYWICSNDKFQKVSGIKFNSSLSEKLSLTIDWYRKKGWL